MKKRLEDLTEPEIKEMMISAARAVSYQLSRVIAGKPQFTLLVFNDPKVAQYLSSCERSTMIEALKETVERLERKQDVTR